jgi:hypothetical protein
MTDSPIDNPYHTNILIINVSAKFAVAPMDKSIPFTDSENVSPIAITVIIEILRSTVIMLLLVKNMLELVESFQLINVKITNTKAMVNNVPHFAKKSGKEILSDLFLS